MSSNSNLSADVGPVDDDDIVSHTQPWTDETVSLFWKYENTRVRSDSFYFSYQCGPALITLAKEFDRLRGRVLDYSAARGHLVERLLEEPSLSVEAVEYTEEAVEALNRKFQNCPQWKRATQLQEWLQRDSRQYDLIFCIEVIEHLIAPHLENTLEELYRSVAPGGAVLLTTPNEEALQDHFAFCPFCRTEFHPVQHVRSFSAQSLRQSLEAVGFEVEYAQSMNLNLLAECLNPDSWKKSRYNYLKMQMQYRYCKTMDAIAPGSKSRLIQWCEQHRGPNLLVLATRPQS